VIQGSTDDESSDPEDGGSITAARQAEGDEEELHDDNMFCFTANSKSEEEGARYDSDSFLMIVDNACTYCITNDMTHFIGTPEPIKQVVKGFGGHKVMTTFKGTVSWKIPTDDGDIHEDLIPNTYFQADSPYCLYSPQHAAQVANDNFPNPRGTCCITYADAVELYWDQRTEKRTIKLDPSSNVAILRSAPSFNTYHAFVAKIDAIEGNVTTPVNTQITQDYAPTVTDDEDSGSEDDDSLTDVTEGNPEKTKGARVPGRKTMPTARRHPDLPNEVFGKSDGAIRQLPNEDVEVQGETAQARMLAWHYRLGHVPFDKIRQMAARGDLPSDLLKCKTPKCAACIYGKFSRRPWRTKAPANKNKVPAATAPGAVVSIDQMISSTPGLIAQMRGFLTRKRYTTTTVFVDHHSGLSFVYLQQSTTAFETVEAKKAFERYAKTYGVTIKHYHADNGIFAAAEFVRAIEESGQSITYCGVNAHHQNGRAEKKIRDLQDQARTMILHAQQRWPTAVTANLWPYAVRMANDISNFAPGIKTGISPLESFSQVAVAPRVKHSHTFGSPMYVLDSQLQTAGQSLPKWNKKARVGMYLGSSPRHSRKVSLVLNLETGHVSPQFHVISDDLFETLRPSAGNVTPKSLWQAATGFVKMDSTTLPPDMDSQAESTTATHTSTLLTGDVSDIPDSEIREERGENEVSNVSTTTINPNPIQNGVGQNEQTAGNNQTSRHIQLANVPLITTRSGRVSVPSERARASREQSQTSALLALHVSWELYHDGGYQIEEEMDDPIAFAASNNPDVMYYDQALKEPDSEKFEEAMIKEVMAHTDNEHWEIVRKSDVPKDDPVLPSVWAMRRKRRIATGEPYKWKARLNLHGGKQEYGVNYWETYAPVIGWTTIRLFLVLTLLNGWASRQVDFVLAYPQADIECPMYMEIPRGFKFQGSRKTHCLLLKKNLYGQKQAGRVWNEYLHNGLLARGFVQSKVDMCLYYRGKVAMLIYTDDGIFVGPTSADIDEAIRILQQPVGKDGIYRAFNLTDEGDLNDYLGVKVDHLPNGHIKLSQPHLIQQVIDDLGFNDRTSTKPTPAASTIKLHRDMHGNGFQEIWSYRSVIGKLNFIEKSTRPDISYAVHQCARFASDPKVSHAHAVKRIVKYLIGTKDKGIILNPRDHSFDCWVDADFVGNWDRVYADVDPATAKSRTGFVVTYAGCPITWASKLQTEVALSTTEAEYNALSSSLREVIHMMQLVEEAKDLGWTTFVGKPTVHCTVFEDNSGALEMARLPKMRPRTKHLCVRLHHFRERVRNGSISIQHVASELQIADMLTKPQPETLFVTQREMVLQWKAERQSQSDSSNVSINEGDNENDTRTAGASMSSNTSQESADEQQHECPQEELRRNSSVPLVTEEPCTSEHRRPNHLRACDNNGSPTSESAIVDGQHDHEPTADGREKGSVPSELSEVSTKDSSEPAEQDSVWITKLKRRVPKYKHDNGKGSSSK
jgi:hypothetical protein